MGGCCSKIVRAAMIWALLSAVYWPIWIHIQRFVHGIAKPLFGMLSLLSLGSCRLSRARGHLRPPLKENLWTLKQMGIDFPFFLGSSQWCLPPFCKNISSFQSLTAFADMSPLTALVSFTTEQKEKSSKTTRLDWATIKVPAQKPSKASRWWFLATIYICMHML